MAVWRKGISSSGNSKSERSEKRLCLVCSINSKEVKVKLWQSGWKVVGDEVKEGYGRRRQEHWVLF